MHEQGLGIVVIGRNEGERLRACLRSLPADARVVYVDSGSTDGSVAAARASGATVVELPPGTPFTAALARNSGLSMLPKADCDFVQMVDGDCMLAAGWLDAGTRALTADPALAAVFGRRRERFPERSVYNRLCDDEWNVPVGEVRSCGGDALFRRAALDAAGGYTPTMIAGEEPDMCLRMRGAGWHIRRIDHEMTLHDAAMTRFGQWWRRARRSGHAFAELCVRNGARADPAWRRALRSAAIWGAALPLAILLCLLLRGKGPWTALALVLVYPLQWARLTWRGMRGGRPRREAAEVALFLILSAFPTLIGVADYAWRRLRGTKPRLIEYKGAA